MITHAFRVAIAVLTIAVLAIPLLLVNASAGEVETSHTVVNIKRVVDGDTVELVGGDKVRLLGIDTPERGEPFAGKATNRLKELVGSGVVQIASCEERDRYGRLLSVVYSEGVNVNLALVEEGMALPLLIPPCGIPVARDVLESAAAAAAKGNGLYDGSTLPVVSHLDADEYTGQRAMVFGKITGLHKGPRAWHLNFGEDYRTDFTAVLFANGRSRFDEFKVRPEDLVGSEVLVIGKVKSYNGPEIIVNGPEQVLILSAGSATVPGTNTD